MKKLILVAVSVVLATTIAMAQPPKGDRKGGAPKQPNLEQRLADMKVMLDLTDAQYNQILAMEKQNQAEHQQKSAEKKQNAKQSRKEQMEARKAHMEARKAEMKKILTDSQYEKYELMTKKMAQQKGSKDGKPVHGKKRERK